MGGSGAGSTGDATPDARDGVHVLFATLLDAAPMGLALLDEQLLLVRVNPRMAALDGVPIADHAGRALSEVAPALASRVDPLVRAVKATGVRHGPYPFEVAEPTPRHLEASCSAVPWTDGGRRLVLMLVDTTERRQAEARLRHSEGLLAEAQRVAGLGSWEWDVAADRIAWSDELLRIFARPGEAPRSFPAFLDLLTPGDRGAIEAAVRTTLATGRPFCVEHRVVRPDGDERQVESRGHVVRDGDGRPLRMTGTCLDITQRKRAEQAIREQQLFVDAIVENIPNMIFVKDAKELRFVRFNRAGEELLGHPREALLGRTDHDLFPPSEADAFTRQDRQVLAERRVLDCPEDPIHTRTHGVRILQSKKVPILDDHGEPAYLLGISEDVTERKRAEAFRLSDLLVQSMVDYAVFLLDPQGRVKTWNAGAERMTGYTAEDLVGRPFALLAGDASGAGDERLLATATARGHVVDEGPWRRKDGGSIWRVTAITAIRDEHGEVSLFGAVTRDVSERKRAEDERERLLQQLREALRLRDEFLSVASHELRTPITALKLQAEVLQRLGQHPGSVEGGQLPSLIRKMGGQVDRLEKLVEGLLDVTRLAAGRVDLRPAEVDLAQVAGTVVDRVRGELVEPQVLELDAPSPVVGWWDPLRLDQVVTNLLSNAVKYGLRRPIRVSVAGDGREARLTVCDHGIGVAPADHGRIFGQFERAVSERNYGGLGLGLFIVRQIVEAMHGTITVDSRVGHGATFDVRLPCGPPGTTPTNGPRRR